MKQIFKLTVEQSDSKAEWRYHVYINTVEGIEAHGNSLKAALNKAVAQLADEFEAE